MIAVSFVILSSTCTTEEAALCKECAPSDFSAGRAGLPSALPSESWAGWHGNAIAGNTHLSYFHHREAAKRTIRSSMIKNNARKETVQNSVMSMELRFLMQRLSPPLFFKNYVIP